MRIKFSKTKVGALLLGLAQVVKVFAPEWSPVVEAVGITLTGVGVRDAIAKNGSGE